MTPTRSARPGSTSTSLARTFLRAIIKQILIDGFFHADPHPGNIIVDTRDGRISFIDLGLVGQLTTDQRTDLLDLLASVQSKDSKAIAAVAIRLCTHTGPVDEQRRLPGRRPDRLPAPHLRLPPRSRTWARS